MAAGGAGSRVQRFPSNCWTALMLATQRFVVSAAAEVRLPMFGTVRLDHDVPSYRCTMEALGKPRSPTAKTTPALRATTALRRLGRVAPPGLG